jgi:hypothetical protein
MRALTILGAILFENLHAMHHQSVFSLSRLVRAFFCVCALALLVGCDLQVTDLTPKAFPENPSHIYTLGLRVEPKTNKVEASSIGVRVVVDGQIHEMRTGDMGRSIFEYEFKLPAGRDELAYYYIIDYKIEHGGGTTRREEYTEVTRTRVVGRYVLTLETNRGPVGSRIAVVGRGFSSTDVVKFDDQTVPAVIESANSLTFIVPAVETGRNYRVSLEGAAGTSPIGTFRVDPASIIVSPAYLTLIRDGRVPLTFTIPTAAPAGGLLLDVTTDIPASVIMPEVIIKEGQNSVTINVRGGSPGVGNLFLKGYGPTGETTVPVVVQ